MMIEDMVRETFFRRLPNDTMVDPAQMLRALDAEIGLLREQVKKQQDRLELERDVCRAFERFLSFKTFEDPRQALEALVDELARYKEQARALEYIATHAVGHGQIYTIIEATLDGKLDTVLGPEGSE